MSFKPYTEKIKKKKIGICSILGRIRIRIQNRTRIRIHHPRSGSADPDQYHFITLILIKNITTQTLKKKKKYKPYVTEQAICSGTIFANLVPLYGQKRKKSKSFRKIQAQQCTLIRDARRDR